MSKSTAFRFIGSVSTGRYSVWRGELHIGHVAKVAHSFRGRRLGGGWAPIVTLHGIRTEHAVEISRAAAADALWLAYQDATR